MEVRRQRRSDPAALPCVRLRSHPASPYAPAVLAAISGGAKSAGIEPPAFVGPAASIGTRTGAVPIR